MGQNSVGYWKGGRRAAPLRTWWQTCEPIKTEHQPRNATEIWTRSRSIVLDGQQVLLMMLRDGVQLVAIGLYIGHLLETLSA
jgi:hypothetical protein